MKTLKHFTQNHKRAIKVIQSFIGKNSSSKDIKALALWMLKGNINHADYLPQLWAEKIKTTEGFAEFLKYTQQAKKEGNLCFIKVSDAPRIVFTKYDDPQLKEKALTDEEKQMFSHLKDKDIIWVPTLTVEKLDIKMSEFGDHYNAYRHYRNKILKQVENINYIIKIIHTKPALSQLSDFIKDKRLIAVEEPPIFKINKSD